MSLSNEIREANTYADEHNKAYRQEARDRLATANNVYQLLSLQVEEACEKLDDLQFLDQGIAKTPASRASFLARVLVEALQEFESATAKEARDLA